MTGIIKKFDSRGSNMESRRDRLAEYVLVIGLIVLVSVILWHYVSGLQK
jgi:hypothetical protein